MKQQVKFTAGDRFRVVADECGDLPVRYMRRKGTILGEDKHHSFYNLGPTTPDVLAYKCKLDCHKTKTTILYQDEIEKLEDE